MKLESADYWRKDRVYINNPERKNSDNKKLENKLEYRVYFLVLNTQHLQIYGNGNMN